ncbi:hypothetical protein [Sorangium sp. So ce362]|uniref:hypothetical protein n=1 Tax=Sorangium sp. So ce362 TaxID=3133303 RepID=UPI003F60B5A1
MTPGARAAPPLAGVAERVGPSEFPELLLRLDEPGLVQASVAEAPLAAGRDCRGGVRC